MLAFFEEHNQMLYVVKIVTSIFYDSLVSVFSKYEIIIHYKKKSFTETFSLVSVFSTSAFATFICLWQFYLAGIHVLYNCLIGGVAQLTRGGVGSG